MAFPEVSSTAASPAGLIERLQYHATNNPEQDAVVSNELTLSYAELEQLVYLQARQFFAMGLSAESVIAIKCAQDIPHLIFCLAATYVGAMSCAVSSHEPEQSQKIMMDRSGATVVVDETVSVVLSLSGSGSRAEIEALSSAASAACLLFSTSGTTGEPKLVVHYDSDLVAQAHRHIESEQQRFVCLASMEHNFSKRHRLYCVAAGATNVFVDGDLSTLVDQCREFAVNVLHVSAFQAQELLVISSIGDLSSIRLKLGGSHVPASLRQQLRDTISSNTQAGYGTTETGAIAFTAVDDLAAGESVGQPLPGIEVRAVTPDGKSVPTGEKGELIIRGKGMFREYLFNSELTGARLKDGWFYTGDIGYLDDQQRIYLSGRSDDMFLFNSMNIYPQDIESQICQYPGITEAVVLPKASSLHGNIPIALVVFEKNTKPKIHKLKKFVKDQVGVRCPRQFIIVDEIPRNVSGKISRGDAVSLSNKSADVRKSIIDALDTKFVDQFKPSFISAFERGDTDITLREIDMDSIARMDLLITLEVDYDTVITPQEFSEFRSLGNIVARVLSPKQRNDKPLEISSRLSSIDQTLFCSDSQHYVINFFQRVFGCCDTVAQLNKALGTLEHRLTPSEVVLLSSMYSRQQLIPVDTLEKFHSALTQWLERLNYMMLGGGKSSAEPFISKRIAPTVTHFIGTGDAAEKKLLICFAEAGGRGLMMPNAVLMQHTDAARFDVLMVAEPLNQNYQHGVPMLGKDVDTVVEWIANLELLNNYESIRTIGCSAGCYPAVIAAYRLKAELAVSVGGRFHSERHPIKILERIFKTWRAVDKRHSPKVLMTYADEIKRDRDYANIIGWISNASYLSIKLADGEIGHLVLQKLVERNVLAPFLARTIFAETYDDIFANKAARRILSLPEDKVEMADN